jgi:deoxyribonuclease-4
VQPSTRSLQQTLDKAAEVGAKGVIVHGGHVGKGDDPEAGFDNWRTLRIDGVPIPQQPSTDRPDEATTGDPTP